MKTATERHKIIAYGSGHAQLAEVGGRDVAFCRAEDGGAELAARIGRALEQEEERAGLLAEIEALRAQLAAVRGERDTYLARLRLVDVGPALFGPTVARPYDVEGKPRAWLLMNTPEKGYASTALEFKSLEEIERRFRVRLGAWGKDKHGEYREVIPLPKLPAE